MSEQTPESEANEVEQEQEVTLSAGTILKQAREKAGLSLDELSEQIRVPVNVLEAIEIDKVPKNLPDTFIRGYIRSYARKLEVDESIVLPEVETVAAINKTTSQSQSSMQSFSRRTRRKASEKRLIYFTWLMVIAVVIAVVMWWLQDSQNSDFAPVVDTQPALQSQLKPAEEPVTEKKTPQLETATTSLVAQPEVEDEIVESAAQTQLDSTPAEIDQVDDSEQQTAELESDKPVELTEEQLALVADNGEPDESGFLKVEMQFENECWVEVYDVANERIAVGNKPAGYLMTLNAQGPLNVLLGNPVGVSVWVNGKVYDMSDKPKNKVARFELEAM